jgi:ribosomal protein S18 acetylase RimI-like enzyme
MIIKKTTVDDADILAELCSEIQGLHIRLQPLIFRKPSHQELVDIFRERISDPDYIAFLAFNEEKPVGYIVLHILRKPENVFAYARNILEIDHIHINEKYWRQGICKKLFAKALEVARSFDIENIQLGVWAQNDRAISAFNSLGFKQQFYIMVFEDRSKLEPSNTADSQGRATVPD